MVVTYQQTNRQTNKQMQAKTLSFARDAGENKKPISRKRHTTVRYWSKITFI